MPKGTIFMINVVFLGLVSFFSDISTEMVYPLIPLYLSAAFGATPAAVGVIEGIAESVASLLKVFSGYFTDRFGRKKRVAFIGYSGGLVYKIALIFASSQYGVLAARVIDRTGKGIRTAPRDVLVNESAAKGKAGNAFGMHKAMDMAGSAIGILLAYILMNSGSAELDYKKLFAYSAIPAIIGLACMVLVREEPLKTREQVKREPLFKNAKQLDGKLKLYLVIAFIFTLGNSSNSFLLLRAKDAGFTDKSVVLLYFLYTIVAAVLALPCGRLSDKIGRKKLLVPGYLAFAAVYAGFAFVTTKAGIIAIFTLYGVYTALISGAERAYIAEISPPHLKGTMLGLHSTIVGIALLPASALAGILWESIGAYAPFLFGSMLSLLAAVLLLISKSSSKKVKVAQ